MPNTSRNAPRSCAASDVHARPEPRPAWPNGAHGRSAASVAPPTAAAIPDAVMLDQLSSPANPDVHRRTTGEIWPAQLPCDPWRAVDLAEISTSRPMAATAASACVAARPLPTCARTQVQNSGAAGLRCRPHFQTRPSSSFRRNTTSSTALALAFAFLPLAFPIAGAVLSLIALGPPLTATSTPSVAPLAPVAPPLGLDALPQSALGIP
jgi:hypothetical protein